MVNFVNGQVPANDVNLNKLQTDLYNAINTAITNLQTLIEAETGQKVYEHTFTTNTNDLTINLEQAGFSIEDGDVFEILFVGSLASNESGTVETLAILPNGLSSFATQRMYLTEFANNAVSTVGNGTVGVKNSLPRIARGNSNFRTICKTIMNFKGGYLSSSLDYASTRADTGSISGKANALVGTIQSISSLMIDGVAENTYITAGSKLIIYKK